MSTSGNNSNSLFQAESAIVRSDNGSEVVRLKFARPSYLRYDEVTETLYVGFSGSAFPVDNNGAFTRAPSEGLSIGLAVDVMGVLSALDLKARDMSKEDWNGVLENRAGSLSNLANAMQKALGQPRPAELGSQSTVNGCKSSVLLSQDLRPPHTDEYCTSAPISQALPETVIEKRVTIVTKDGKQVEKQTLHITVTLPRIRDTRNGRDVFVGQRIVNNVGTSSASALSKKFAPQLDSLAHPSCSEAQEFGVAHSAACIAQPVIQRQLAFDTWTADVDYQQPEEACQSTQSILGTAYSPPPTLVVRAAEDE